MKRRIFTFLLAAALVLLTACSGRGTEPPVRIGEAIGEASLLRSYSAAEAFQEADAVALVRVGDWLGEQDGGFPITFYKAAVVKSYKGDLPREFTLMQNGGSAGTYEDYPLYTCGNELLVFLRKADADYPDAYQSVGSFSTVLYAADAVDGSYVINHVSLTDPAGESFRKEYAEKYNGAKMELNGYMAHDAFLTWVAAVEKAGSDDPQAITDAYTQITVEGLTGTIKISPEDHNPVDKAGCVERIDGANKTYIFETKIA